MKYLSIILTLFAANASAALITPQLCDIVPSAACLDDTGLEVFAINDTDGALDTITSFVFDRSASFSNSLFFYDVLDSSNRLDIFDGADGPFAAETIFWDGISYSTAGGSATFGSGAVFGLGIDTGAGTEYFSQSALNAGGLDHLLTFQTLGNTPSSGFLNVQNLTFAWEDQVGLGDMDYNDIVATCIDCIPTITPIDTPVPAPAPLALMAFGLIALGSRRVLC